MRPINKIVMLNSSRADEHEKERKYPNDGDYKHNRYDDEMRLRDDRGREHYNDGRYAPMRNEYYPIYRGNDNDSRDGDIRNYSPNIYEYRGNNRDRKITRVGDKPMNKIGFSIEGEMGKPEEFYPKRANEMEYNHIDEMSHHNGEKQSGYAISEEGMPLTKEMAHEWAERMKNEDGTTGPHWTLDQAKQVMAQKEIDGSPIDFWVTLNMMYSDYCKVAKKLGVNTVEFYACMAEAFLDDADSVDDKLAAYYEYVVKH